MKSILKKMSEYKLKSILAPLFKFIEAGLELAIPLILSTLVDNGLVAGNNSTIKICCVLLVVFPLVGLAFSLTAQYFSSLVAVEVSAKTRSDLFKKFQSLTFSQFDKIGNSKMINTITSDVNQLQTGINLSLRLLLRSPIVVIGATILAILVDIKLGFIFVLVTLILSIVVFLVMKKTIPMYKNNQKKLDKVLNTVREQTSGIKVIRAFNQEKNEKLNFQKQNMDLSENQISAGKISALLNPITYLIVNVAIILIVYFGGVSVNIGGLSQGKVIALYNYMTYILVELLKFANLMITLNKSIASSNRIDEIMNLNPTIVKENKKPIETNSQIVFENVSFKYDTKFNPVLKDLNFSIEQGEFVGIIGSTGSGKTTLVNLIPRLYETSSGNIYIDGKNIKTYEKTELLNMFGIVSQPAVLFKGSIKENILWGKPDATDKEIEIAINKSQSKNVIDSKKQGLKHLVLQEGKNLSGGQKQRLTIARALVRKPKILVLDDSTSALDYRTEANIRKELKNLDYNPTIIVVSQRTSILETADKIIVLDKGNVVGFGNHKTLLNDCEIYREIHNSQGRK